ncbi:hypothetical protein BFP70_07285 [Thioclava sp. SK-1]|uniref:DMT family transporter n=1 Tax=Thioclava sp. SK-1 TaxID=1889770 RepID=UPI0008270097|nr:DMT family transporter [Thioclava sp. SK-1]OCX65922.1 hypothetical protein BFP70_07285 [Thioclava sp. SK-1]
MENTRGAILMVAAMAAFAMEDMFIKAASQQAPIGEVLMAFGFVGMLGFMALARSRGQALWHRAIGSRFMLMKATFEIIGRVGYTLGIALTPLSNASAILQATPLVVVAGAAMFFGEKVGPRRWAAIGVGFLAVLLILRPGLDGFRPAALFTLMGMLGFAGRDLATRGAPKVLTNFQLGIYGFAALIPAGALILLVQGEPRAMSGAVIGLVLAASVFGVLAYWALTAAMRMGDISVVTPFRYTRLLFAIILGALVFGERPDALMIVGAALIVVSGVYTLRRGA